MRAWFLILVVLATFKPIVQVASTEDLPTTFSTAVSTRSVTSLAAFYEPVFQVPRVSFAQTAILYYSDKSESDIFKTTHNDKKSISVTATTENSVHEEQRPVKKVDLSVKKSNQLENFKQENTYKLFDEVEKNYKFSKMTVAKHTKSSEPSNQPASKVIGYAPSKSRPLEVEALEIAPLREVSPPAAMLNAEEQRPNSLTDFVASEDTSPSALPPTSSLESSHNRLVKEGADVEDHDTYSNKEVIGEKIKPDPSTLVEIENSLLSLFNMKRPPKIDRSKIVIPEVMKQLYSQIMGHDIDSVNIPKPGILTKSANTVRSFTHQDSKIDDRFLHHHRFRVHFDVRSIPINEKLKAAELHLWRDAISHAVLHPRLANRTRYQVLVYDITRVGIRGKREPTYLLLDNKTIRLNNTDTVSLDVHPAVDRWLETPKRNYGLLIEVRTFRALKPAPHHHVRLRRSADEPHEHWQRKQPLLFTYTDDGRHKSNSIRDINSRSKRSGHHRRPHRRKNNVETCRRQSLYVDFADVGWSDWIVAPPGYDAYYCHGKCPFPLADHLNSTNHAVVQTLVNNLNPGKVPNACCVPTQLTGISMLYLNDQSTVVLKNYQDMTVVGCGCR